MNVLLLITAMLAQNELPALTNYDFLRINGPFEQLRMFDDNEFILEEKLKAAEEEAKEYEGRKVELEVVVKSVRKEGLSVGFFANVESKRDLPFLWLIDNAATGAKPITPRHEAYLGQARDNRGELRIGEKLPLELAKTLRQGDRLMISGSIRDSTGLNAGSFGTRYVARVVIVVDTIETIAPGEPAGGIPK